MFCAITHDGEGSLLNSNADSVASAVAVAAARIAPTDMHFCFEKLGVLRDVEDEDSLIAEIRPDSYRELRETGVVNKGMIPKLTTLSALSKQVCRALRSNIRTICCRIRER